MMYKEFLVAKLINDGSPPGMLDQPRIFTGIKMTINFPDYSMSLGFCLP